MTVDGARTEAASTNRSRELGALAAWLGLVAILIALGFASGGVDQEDRGEVIYRYSLGIGGIVQAVFLLGLTAAIATLDSSGRRDALGLRRFDHRALWPAAGTVVLAIVVGAIVESFLHAGEKQGLTPQSWEPDRAPALVFNSLVIVTLTPLSEELLFRGLGVRVLGVLGAAVAVGGSAVLFGLVHGIPEALPPLVVFGLGLAWVRHRYGSVWPSVIAHAGYNALGIAISFASV